MQFKLPQILLQHQRWILRFIGFASLPLSGYLWYLCYKNFRKPKEIISWADDDTEFKNKQILDAAVEGYKIVKLKIPLRAVGAVVGRQGSTVKKIQSMTKTTIQMEGQNSNASTEESSMLEYRELTIKGLAHRVLLAEKEIKAIIEGVPVIEEEYLMVESRFIGRIIGKNGENTRRIKAEYNCKVSIPQVENNDDTVRQVVLQGSREQIECAKLYIVQMIRDIECREKNRPRNGIAPVWPNTPGYSRPLRDENLHVPSGNVHIANAFSQRKDPIGRAISPDIRDESPSLMEDSYPVVDLMSNDSRMSNKALLPSRAEFPRSTKPIPIKVSSVTDCCHLSAQIATPECRDQLNQLVQELTQYFSFNNSSQPNSLEVGDPIAALFSADGSWQRAVVHNIQPVYLVPSKPFIGLDANRTNVDLDYSDYGDCATVPLKDVRSLTGDDKVASLFLRLPFQAIPLKLAGIKSKIGGWSEEAIEYFERITGVAEEDLLLMAYFQSESEDNGVPIVRIVNPACRPPMKQDLADEMVRAGFAIWDTA